MGDVTERDARPRTKRLQQLTRTEKQLTWTCNQIDLLNDKLRGLAARYIRAKADGNNSFRYSYRLRWAAVEGAKNVLSECARARAEEAADMRRQLFNQVVTIFVTRDRPSLAITGYYYNDDEYDSDAEEDVAYYDDGYDDDDDDDDDEEDDTDDDDMDDVEYAAYYDDEADDEEFITTDSEGDDSVVSDHANNAEDDDVDVDDDYIDPQSPGR